MWRLVVCSIVSATLALSAVVAGTPAHAGSVARARQFFRKAEEQFARGQYHQAAELYERAYRAKPLPALLINIGQCHRKLGDCNRALRFYQRYLVAEPTGRHRLKAEALIKACAEEQAANGLLEEQKRQQAVQQQQPEQAAAGEQLAAGEVGAAQPGGAVPGTREGLHPIYFWSGVGVAAAMLLTGTVTGGIALSKSSKYEDPATPAADLPGLRDSGQDLKVAANITFAVGITAAAGAAVLYFFTDFGSAGARASPSPAVSAVPLAGGGGVVTLGGAF